MALASVFLAPAVAHAGWQTIECISKRRAIKFSTQNFEIEINDSDRKTRTKGSIKRPLSLQPNESYVGKADEKVITAIPISERKVLTDEQRHVHVVHKDGTSCNGREIWDTKYRQSYVFTGANGSPLTTELQSGDARSIEGQTTDGYIVVEMICHDKGVTSPGGCRAEDDGDSVTEVRDK